MARRHIHYEAAFEDFVQVRGWPYVPVDERRRAVFAGARVKGFDFLVYPPGGTAWMVDVKGRKFPYEIGGGKRYWENWVTRDDLDGLQHWQGAFGSGFEPVFVFAFWLLDAEERGLNASFHQFRGERYAFLAVSAAAYAESARRRSRKWATVTVPQRRFRAMARSLDPPRDVGL